MIILNMTKLNFEIPKDLEFIKQVPDVDWSILIGKIVKSKLDNISRLKRVVSKSKLTGKDVDEFSDKINISLSKRYLEY